MLDIILRTSSIKDSFANVSAAVNMISAANTILNPLMRVNDGISSYQYKFKPGVIESENGIWELYLMPIPFKIVVCE